MKIQLRRPLEFNFCANPACERLVPTSVSYCCPGCWQAHTGGYQIHDAGPLGHSIRCQERHAAQAGEARS